MLGAFRTGRGYRVLCSLPSSFPPDQQDISGGAASPVPGPSTADVLVHSTHRRYYPSLFQKEAIHKKVTVWRGNAGITGRYLGGVALVPPGTEVSSAFPLYPVPGLGFCAPADGKCERQRPSMRDFIKTRSPAAGTAMRGPGPLSKMFEGTVYQFVELISSFPVPMSGIIPPGPSMGDRAAVPG